MSRRDEQLERLTLASLAVIDDEKVAQLFDLAIGRVMTEEISTPTPPDPLLTCRVCGHTDDLDGFDVLGADPGCVFCNACNSQIDAGSGLPVIATTPAILE